MREKLRQQWEEKQKAIKEEEVEITYSYWDGSGHRKNITMKKGNSIYQFLCKVLDSIRTEFPELKTVSGDQLMYVKEDLIIPQTNTFYDFIVSRARGKSGPLFNFDAHDDIRMVSDATIEKDESHAGKVILRSWYNIKCFFHVINFCIPLGMKGINTFFQQADGSHTTQQSLTQIVPWATLISSILVDQAKLMSFLLVPKATMIQPVFCRSLQKVAFQAAEVSANVVKA